MSVWWKTKRHVKLFIWRSFYRCCSLWIDKSRDKDKTYFWMSVWWTWRLQTKTEESRRLTFTGLVGELEHLKIKTRLIDEKFVIVMGVCDLDMMGTPCKQSVIRKVPVLGRVRTTLPMICEESATRRKWNWPWSVCVSWTPETVKKGGFMYLYFQLNKKSRNPRVKKKFKKTILSTKVGQTIITHHVSTLFF